MYFRHSQHFARVMVDMMAKNIGCTDVGELDYLLEPAAEAWREEPTITRDELDLIVAGNEHGTVPPELEGKFPRVAAVALRAYEADVAAGDDESESEPEHDDEEQESEDESGEELRAELLAPMRRLLLHSWRDIGYLYQGLTSQEKSLVTEEEFLELVAWAKGE